MRPASSRRRVSLPSKWFTGGHFPTDVLLTCVRWYVAYPLSTRYVEELGSGFPRRRGNNGVVGGDLVYVWAAWETKRPLVTVDSGLYQFRSPGLDIYYPGELSAIWRTAAKGTC